MVNNNKGIYIITLEMKQQNYNAFQISSWYGHNFLTSSVCDTMTESFITVFWEYSELSTFIMTYSAENLIRKNLRQVLVGTDSFTTAFCYKSRLHKHDISYYTRNISLISAFEAETCPFENILKNLQPKMNFIENRK